MKALKTTIASLIIASSTAMATATNEDLYQVDARYGDWITTITEDSNHPSSSANRFFLAGTFGITSKDYMLGMSCSPT